jgi:hypothetical protein
MYQIPPPSWIIDAAQKSRTKYLPKINSICLFASEVSTTMTMLIAYSFGITFLGVNMTPRGIQARDPLTSSIIGGGYVTNLKVVSPRKEPGIVSYIFA